MVIKRVEITSSWQQHIHLFSWVIKVSRNGCFYNGPVICPRSVIMALGGCNSPRRCLGPLQPPLAIITDLGYITGPYKNTHSLIL